jgi:hypothetical protein
VSVFGLEFFFVAAVMRSIKSDEIQNFLWLSMKHVDGLRFIKTKLTKKETKAKKSEHCPEN